MRGHRCHEARLSWHAAVLFRSLTSLVTEEFTLQLRETFGVSEGAHGQVRLTPLPSLPPSGLGQ